MKKLTKRLSLAKKKLLKDSYDITSAVKIGKSLATAKFSESMEAHICLNLDPKQANQQFRTTVVLPKGTGKTKRQGMATEKNIKGETKDKETRDGH